MQCECGRWVAPAYRISMVKVDKIDQKVIRPQTISTFDKNVDIFIDRMG
jgi:hypothetical protein